MPVQHLPEGGSRVPFLPSSGSAPPGAASHQQPQSPSAAPAPAQPGAPAGAAVRGNRDGSITQT